MSDLESASDYEVIHEGNQTDEDTTMMGSLQYRALDEAVEQMTNSTVSSGGTVSQDEELPPQMLASVSNFAPSYENGNKTDSSIIPAPEVDFPQIPRSRQKIYAFPEDKDGSEDSEIDSDEAILAAHGEIKKVLQDAVEQMEILKNWKEERAELQDRVATLEGTVDRLSKKNNALQKVNENGTLLDRRRKDKENEGNREKFVEEELVTNFETTGMSTKMKLLLLIIYSFIIGMAVYYNLREADRKIQALEIKVQKEHWNSEQLLARIIILENRLNASFEEIHKLNNVLYSPYSKDIYTIPAENDASVQEINCFIRLNSTTFRVCQRLADDLEREAHENGRLKEKVSMVQRGFAAILPFFVALLVTVAVSSCKFVF